LKLVNEISRFDAYFQNEKIWAATYKQRYGVIYIKRKWIFFTGSLIRTYYKTKPQVQHGFLLLNHDHQ